METLLGNVERTRAIRFATPVILFLGLVAPAVWSQTTVQTIGGGGPNNLPALKSSMGFPTGLALDGTGNVYVADLYSARVLKVDTAGNVTIVAGDGARGSNSALGNGIPAIRAYFAYLTGLAVDSSGNIFTTDSTLCKLREVSAQTGDVSTVTGSTGNCRYAGDGGPAASATLGAPRGVVLDRFGNIFLMDICVVRKISAQTGNISAVAGTPPDITGAWRCGYSGDGGLAINAKIGLSYGLTADGSGNIFIADTENCVIRAVSASSGVISTVAGTGSCGYSGDGGPATSAKLALSNGLATGLSNGVAVDSSGNIFIADTANCAIREVSASNGFISTVAGTGSCGYSGDAGPASSATLNDPTGVAVDSSGNIFITDYNNSVIREVSASTGNISTLAGVAVPDPNHVGQMIGFPAYSGDDYPAPDARLGFLNATPWSAGMATDHSGNVFIADTFNNAIREISSATGIMTTVAGNGLLGYSGDGGPATSAELYEPRDVTVDNSGNIFVMDSGNCVVRKVSAQTGDISTVAGTPPDASGNYYCDYSGDGGPATSAELYPIDLLVPAGGLAVDNSGNLFIADSGNSVIREVSASTGIINTVAGIPLSMLTGLISGTGDGGPATSATLSAPYGVAVDNSGNIFIADTVDFEIREVMAANGNIYTVAGNIALGRGFSGNGGPANLAQFGDVYSTLLDSAGNLFIPDPDNCVIRKVSASTGIVSTVAGTAYPGGGYFCGCSGDGGPALSAIFDLPSVVGAGASGDLIVLDNIRVRSVSGLLQGPAAAAVPFPNPLVFPATPLGSSDTLTVALSNRGSLSTSVSTVAISGTNASDFSEMDNCASHSLGSGGGSCTINVKFNPSTVGTKNALITMTDTAGTQTVNLSGSSVVLTFSTGALTFAAETLGTTSSAQQVTLTNPSTSRVSVPALVISGPNHADFSETDNCAGQTLFGGGFCTINVTFKASVAGAESAQLTAGTQTVNISGAGIDFSVGPANGSPSSVTVTQGQTATYSLQVAATGGMSPSDQVSITIACTGAPSLALCSSTPQSVIANVGTPVALAVSVTTTAPSRAMASPGSGPTTRVLAGILFVGVVLLIPFSSFGDVRISTERRLRRLARLALSAPIVLAIVLAPGCGGGSSSSQPPPVGGTPSGTYTLTLTASSGSDTHTTQLTLIVN